MSQSFPLTKSSAHILFLSIFLEPTSVNNIPKYIDWNKLLGEDPAIMVEELKNKGLLICSNIYTHLPHLILAEIGNIK